MNKFIKIKPHKSNIPYLSTSVSFDKSFREIQDMLMKFGCSDLITRTRPGRVPGTNLDCLLYTIAFINKREKFIIEFPVIILIGGRHGEKMQVSMNVGGRIVLNDIKARLTNVEIGWLSFAQAMVGWAALPSPEGSIALQDVIEKDLAGIQSGVKQLIQIGDGR